MANPLLSCLADTLPLAWTGEREDVFFGIPLMHCLGDTLPLGWSGDRTTGVLVRRRTVDPLAAVRLVPDSPNSHPRVDPLAAESIAPY